jgi:hypothetical protein
MFGCSAEIRVPGVDGITYAAPASPVGAFVRRVFAYRWMFGVDSLGPPLKTVVTGNVERGGVILLRVRPHQPYGRVAVVEVAGDGERGGRTNRPFALVQRQPRAGATWVRMLSSRCAL